VKNILGSVLKWDAEDLYAYGRAYAHHPAPMNETLTVLDPTAGGGSIPFEAMRLGHRVTANELNPVAAVILHATLDYPARYGPNLISRNGGKSCLMSWTKGWIPYFLVLFHYRRTSGAFWRGT
jgi:adenine-specific DNA methylase